MPGTDNTCDAILFKIEAATGRRFYFRFTPTPSYKSYEEDPAHGGMALRISASDAGGGDGAYIASDNLDPAHQVFTLYKEFSYVTSSNPFYFKVECLDNPRNTHFGQDQVYLEVSSSESFSGVQKFDLIRLRGY